MKRLCVALVIILSTQIVQGIVRNGAMLPAERAAAASAITAVAATAPAATAATVSVAAALGASPSSPDAVAKADSKTVKASEAAAQSLSPQENSKQVMRAILSRHADAARALQQCRDSDAADANVKILSEQLGCATLRIILGHSDCKAAADSLVKDPISNPGECNGFACRTLLKQDVVYDDKYVCGECGYNHSFTAPCYCNPPPAPYDNTAALIEFNTRPCGAYDVTMRRLKAKGQSFLVGNGCPKHGKSDKSHLDSVLKKVLWLDNLNLTRAKATMERLRQHADTAYTEDVAAGVVYTQHGLSHRFSDLQRADSKNYRKAKKRYDAAVAEGQRLFPALMQEMQNPTDQYHLKPIE